MFCRKASIGSATTASSPALAARPISRVPGSCSLRQLRLRSKQLRHLRINVHRAPAAAVACSSSRSSDLPLRRVHHLRRLPLPGCRCRDASHEFQVPVEAVVLRPSGARTLVSTTSASTVQMTTKCTCHASLYHIGCVLAGRPLKPLPPPTGTLQSTWHTNGQIKIFKSP